MRREAKRGKDKKKDRERDTPTHRHTHPQKHPNQPKHTPTEMMTLAAVTLDDSAMVRVGGNALDVKNSEIVPIKNPATKPMMTAAKICQLKSKMWMIAAMQPISITPAHTQRKKERKKE